MKKILISDNPWQVRIAIIRNGQLQNTYFDSRAAEILERSYYKGVVTKILPGIQTAFVDIGQERAGFLHISEIDRELSIKRMLGSGEAFEEEEKRRLEPLRHELDINKILKEGEHILVQVSKEPIYKKGAKLTTCFTLPGRFLVLMPNIPRVGVSKKIDIIEERQRLRELLYKNLPKGMGAIVRTTSESRADKEILLDLSYLVKTWKRIQKKFEEVETEEKVYEDIAPSLQVIRDHLDDDVEEVICDTKKMESNIHKFVREIAPEHSQKVKYYSGKIPIFKRFSIEEQIEQALQRKVHLKSGGSIIIEITEAMTVIDVNTGRYTGATKLHETILATNLEAAEEVVRQLRLRNIGGLIVIDFIDMTNQSDRQRLFNFFEKMLKEHDRFQSVVLKVSEFGLVQMTRKRSGKTLLRQMTDICPTCLGSGFVKSAQTEIYKLLRELKSRLVSGTLGKQVDVTLHGKLFEQLIGTEYDSILFLEKNFGCKITLSSSEEGSTYYYSIGSH